MQNINFPQQSEWWCFYFQDLVVVAIVVNKQKFRHLHFLFSERESCMSTTQKKTSSCHQKSFHVFPRHKLVLWLVGSCLFVSWRMICQKWFERKTERRREYWAFLLVNLMRKSNLLLPSFHLQKKYLTTAITFGNVHISFICLVLEFLCVFEIPSDQSTKNKIWSGSFHWNLDRCLYAKTLGPNISEVMSVCNLENNLL